MRGEQGEQGESKGGEERVKGRGVEGERLQGRERPIPYLGSERNGDSDRVKDIEGKRTIKGEGALIELVLAVDDCAEVVSCVTAKATRASMMAYSTSHSLFFFVS